MKISKAFIKKQFSRIPRFFSDWHIYGFSVAVWSLLFVFNHVPLLLGPFVAAKKHRTILRYLFKRYAGVTKKFADKKAENQNTIDPASNIWICWWDGLEAMPPLVRVCYGSIVRHAGDHPVVLITKNNIRDFITIPEYIYEKINAGIMTVTHFSNIVRANLLYDYGGIWLDATILTLKDISLEHLQFYTLKAPALSSSISNDRFAGLTHSFKCFYKTKRDISRWSGFLFAAVKRNPVFDYMREILYAYWKDHNNQIDYLLYDYTIALGYDNIPLMKNYFDSVPCSPMEKFALEKNMNAEYDDKEFAEFNKITFHKLTWKLKFNMYTNDNKLTVYGHILESLKADKQ